MEMGDRIRQIRKALGLTQQEFAEKVGSTANVYTNYETGKRNPSASVINNICKTFGVNEVWLRTGEGEMFRQLSRNERLDRFVDELLAEESDSFRNRLVAALAGLTTDQWEVLAHLAESLAAGHAESAPAPAGVDPEEAELQRRVADYERELREEQEARRRSEASQDTSETA